MVIPWYFLKVFPYKKVLWQYHDAIMVSNGNTTVILKYTIGLKFIYYGILKTTKNMFFEHFTIVLS